MSIRKGDNVIAGASVGFIGKPAWSQAVAISAADLVAGYTAPSDGLIVGSVESVSGQKRLYVNGVMVTLARHGDTWVSDGNIQVQINKGDILTMTASAAGEFKFVPFEYSGVSDINVITPEYIRNQNILSDYEAITLSTNASSPTVMQYDGFIEQVLGSASSANAAVFVNNIQIVRELNPTTGGNISTMCIPVKKGDALYVQGTFTAVEGKARFYKLRDYSGR